MWLHSISWENSLLETGIAVLGILVPISNSKEVPSIFPTLTSLLISICLLNISTQITFHLSKSNSLIFLLTPLALPPHPRFAITEEGGAISPVTMPKTLASFLPLFPALTPSPCFHSFIHSLPYHQQYFLSTYYTSVQGARNKNMSMTDSASRTS